ncbi:lycopene cyclase family protein [Actinoalloteichus caeruleus]|uniref:lycopene cyclase family protein n=1 Tax=Actinoalloteichus cyanogriseus TaxID=2893586 RepID=UPI0004C2A78B|nr:lycopene cyclase family protein [Actinoalloteichus caeruleus]
MSRQFDVTIVGSGPAGTALAAACADEGFATALVAPFPRRPWRPTYACFADELPADVRRRAVRSRSPRVRVAAATQRWWTDREYCVLDNAALAGELRRDSVTLVRGRAVGAEHGPGGSRLRLAGGERLRTTVLVDATGSSSRERGEVPAQTAFGLVLPEEEARRLVAPDEAVMMDWRPPVPDSATATFCYCVPLGDGRVLVEETSLVRRPGLPIVTLRELLHARLRRHGVRVSAAQASERVWIDMSAPRPAPRRVLRFGSAAGMLHPASGYGVAAALASAAPTARALARHWAPGPRAAVAGAHGVLWPPAARMVHALRTRGREALLGLSPRQTSRFFEAFFGLPAELRTAYLSSRHDLVGTMSAMLALFGPATPDLRARLVLGTMLARP